jgi:hypothetical protein
MRLPDDTLKCNARKVLNAFPAYLKSDVETAIEFLLNRNFDIQSEGQRVVLDGEELTIPGRVYFKKPDKMVNNLTSQQQTIINCLYLRHQNGFVRQKCLELLLDKTDYYITPFIFQLLGEYVIEILMVADKAVNDLTISNYVKFVQDNPNYWQQTESRVISYWNEHYRYKYPKINSYIGKSILERIKTGKV